MIDFYATKRTITAQHRKRYCERCPVTFAPGDEVVALVFSGHRHRTEKRFCNENCLAEYLEAIGLTVFDPMTIRVDYADWRERAHGYQNYTIYYRDWNDPEAGPRIILQMSLKGDEATNCEMIYAWMNDGPFQAARRCRSMSVGDFIIINEDRRALCASIGFIIKPWSWDDGLIPEGEPRNHLDLALRY